jgi:DNA repair exonuclease SbcCD ATPase subunit
VISGEGLGRGFLVHFLPEGVNYGAPTLQNAIDSYYSDSRKAAALRKAEAAKVEAAAAEKEAEEAAREAEEAAHAEAEARRKQSEAKRLQLEAEAAAKAAKNAEAEEAARKEAATREKEAAEAARTAKAQATKASAQRTAATRKTAKAKEHRTTSAKAEAEAEKVDAKGINRELLERLPSASYMREIVQLASSENIPSKYHERLIQACLDEGWVAAGGRSMQVGHSILKAGKVWWFKVSGRADELRAKAKVESRQWKNREKTLDEFLEEVHGHMKALVRELDACIPFADQVQNPTLASSLDSMAGAALSAISTFREKLPRKEDTLQPDLKRIGAID